MLKNIRIKQSREILSSAEKIYYANLRNDQKMWFLCKDGVCNLPEIEMISISACGSSKRVKGALYVGKMKTSDMLNI